MKFLVLLFSSCVLSAWAQTPAVNPATPNASNPNANNPLVNVSPDTVLATIQGKKLTAGDLQRYMGVLPPQMQQAVLRDRKEFVQQYALMMRLSEMAEKARLDQQSPYKESLEFNRMYLMSVAELNDAFNRVPVLPEDQKKYYEANKDRYKQVKLKVIYIPFSANPAAQTDSKAKRHLTEAEAKAKIEKLREDIRGGADFVKLVKENSEDATSAAKDGDFGTVRRSDNLPDNIRSVVFALKPGEVSAPVRQPNGFYLFRAEEVTTRPYPEVQDEIFTEIKQARYKQWLEATRKNLDIKIENQAFFSAPAAIPPQPPSAGSK